MALLAHVFEEDKALERLESFTSLNGPAFYRLPVNETTITLVKHELPQTIPEKIFTEAGPVTVFTPGFPVHWHVEP
jgi:dihydroorotase